tara:strand:+ start:1843 stop:2151 length:309 start_codon:yes stop_codon:yes gene_type:complete
MLTTPVGAASGTPPKQIAITNTALAGTTMYTVPVGRKFIGYFNTRGQNQPTKINGVNIYPYYGGGTSVVQPGALVEWTLVAGTVVSENTSNQTSIVGVEYDA